MQRVLFLKILVKGAINYKYMDHLLKVSLNAFCGVNQ